VKGFKEHLRGQGVSEKQLSHYVAWVMNYADFCDDRHRDYWGEESIQAYMKASGRLNAEWKVSQAEDAVRQYIFWRQGQKESLYMSLLKELEKEMGAAANSFKTLEAYKFWVEKFLLWSGKERGWGFDDFQSFIKVIVVEQGASIASQNQAISALRCFFEKVLKVDLASKPQRLRAKKLKVLPSIMNRELIRELFQYLEGVDLLLVKLMYGCGLRCGEVYKLRVGDVDLRKASVRVMSDKGVVKREVFLPTGLCLELKRHLIFVKGLYLSDQGLGLSGGWVEYYLFPSLSLARAEKASEMRRDHYNDRSLRRHFNAALDALDLKGAYKLGALRDSFAVHYLEEGGDVRTLQVLMGHQKVAQTMVYSRLAGDQVGQIKSPLDKL
jgi:site-specific recombinase XerD